MSHDKSSIRAGETKMKDNTIRCTFLFSCLVFLLGISGLAHAAHYTVSVDSPSVREGGNLSFTMTLDQPVVLESGSTSTGKQQIMELRHQAITISVLAMVRSDSILVRMYR